MYNKKGLFKANMDVNNELSMLRDKVRLTVDGYVFVYFY